MEVYEFTKSSYCYWMDFERFLSVLLWSTFMVSFLGPVLSRTGSVERSYEDQLLKDLQDSIERENDLKEQLNMVNFSDDLFK